MLGILSLIYLRVFGDKSGVTVDRVGWTESENVEKREERKSGLDLRGLWSTSQV